MTEKDFAAYLRSQRTTTAQEAAEVERKRDRRNGVYVPHMSAHPEPAGAARH